ncbi:MAG: hypothetical protein WCI45_14250, partial [Desulfuromonadales bacterium]
GYTVHGNKIRRNRKTYFTPEAIDFRYNMIDEDLKGIIKSPADLAAAEARTLARLLSYSGKKASGKTFDTCFTEVLEDAARRRST